MDFNKNNNTLIVKKINIYLFILKTLDKCMNLFIIFNAIKKE
jgi:hypothetical protein